MTRQEVAFTARTTLQLEKGSKDNRWMCKNVDEAYRRCGSDPREYLSGDPFHLMVGDTIYEVQIEMIRMATEVDRGAGR